MMVAHPLPLVRLAQPEDEGPLMEMCRALHAENGLFSFDDERVRDLLRKFFARQGVIVGVIGSPGDLRACTCLMLSDFYYSRDWYLAELWNYVGPDHRSSGMRCAEALIEFGKSCAREMNVPLVTGIITNRQMAGKVRLYQRLLGRPIGASFIYNGAWVPEPAEDVSDIRQRLGEAAQRCSTGRVPRGEVLKLASLLREAAGVLQSDMSIWGQIRERHGAPPARQAG